MSNLVKAFDQHGFDRERFFIVSFDTIPSILALSVPIKRTKKKITEVLNLMGLNDGEYELIFKKWSTEDASDATFEKDFPYQFLYKHLEKKGLVWVSIRSNTLYVTFLYDCKDLFLENWILDTNDMLRKRFGLAKTPTFYVLKKSKQIGFTTQSVKAEKISLNVEENYNDDFIEIDEIIKTSLTDQGSGLILLHGDPGTGKTTYIRSLISDFQDHDFIFIQNEFVRNLLDPDFISFLLRQRNSVLIIEDAEKVLMSRDDKRGASVVSTILQLTDGLFSDYLNIKVICTFNTSLSKIDSALLRKGRLIAMYKFSPLSVEKTNKLLHSMGAENIDEELTISDIYNRKQKKFSNVKKRKIGF